MRAEVEILQHQSTSHYIQCVYHRQIIPHAPMYHPNHSHDVSHHQYNYYQNDYTSSSEIATPQTTFIIVIN